MDIAPKWLLHAVRAELLVRACLGRGYSQSIKKQPFPVPRSSRTG
ncbi:hypothetical protein GJA_1258 [Janthinobacterium agaricidamnosum NBRC 102515 = DSM 9628]|uniref:Uncharacterized protein n=1 Tax=Janthinobacterium agaricidamnosum NBRC 102515 = DSM 9628 TaxID=1349767 RepID=W0V220_9BURK|nr:hypothetical protein GJA_1258 [Janthinobacterium agaricidamnosum NBRC 102515 = DSM 9628]